jgi:putative endopeptidase
MAKGINTSFLDTAIQPAEDFYSFVNGGWMKKTEIPEDRSSWGSFHELNKNTDQKILSILEDELSTPGPSTNKAARLFESGMDQKSIQSNGLKPVYSLLQEIDAITNMQDLVACTAGLLRKDLGGLMQLNTHPDLANSHIYSAYLEPGALGLPEREYYLDPSERAKKILDRYQTYVSRILKEYYKESTALPTETSEQIIQIETQLAKNMMSKESRRDINKIYNPTPYVTIKERWPAWDWDQFLFRLGIQPPDQIIVTDPEYFDFFNSAIQEMDLRRIKTYLSFLVIHQSAPFSYQQLEEENFDLYGRALEGIKMMRPRNERVVKIVNSLMGEALGELFVSQYFPPRAKQTALEMVNDIIGAFGNRIKNLAWMGAETKHYALEKLAAIKTKIGYPEEWKDYSKLQLLPPEEGGCYLENVIAAATWKRKIDFDRIGKDVDRKEWFMAPQVVNAYYNPLFNEIVFPAAILQPPFFDWEADAAINYGGIGAVIGHEITHGFDDQGSRFDKNGNIKEWWTETDREKFVAESKKLIEQFDAYYPIEDLSLNGTFTLGENIADLGGLSVAFDALQLYYSRHKRPDKIDGFTQEQRFFISWATIWRTKIREEALRNQIKTDPHPPGRYRAVAAPSNLDSFYMAFGEDPNSPWYRKTEDRIKIW